MTSKEKAKELVDKFYYVSNPIADESIRAMDWIDAKQCAIIACEEIYSLELKVGQYVEETPDKENYYAFWEDVKNEIESL